MLAEGVLDVNHFNGAPPVLVKGLECEVKSTLFEGQTFAKGIVPQVVIVTLTAAEAGL